MIMKLSTKSGEEINLKEDSLKINRIGGKQSQKNIANLDLLSTEILRSVYHVRSIWHNKFAVRFTYIGRKLKFYVYLENGKEVIDWWSRHGRALDISTEHSYFDNNNGMESRLSIFHRFPLFLFLFHLLLPLFPSISFLIFSPLVFCLRYLSKKSISPSILSPLTISLTKSIHFSDRRHCEVLVIRILRISRTC